jgi:hypothetical protein
MTIELTPDELQMVLQALEHYHAYTKAVKRDDDKYRDLAERLKKQGPAREEPQRAGKKKRA